MIRLKDGSMAPASSLMMNMGGSGGPSMTTQNAGGADKNNSRAYLQTLKNAQM